MAAAAFSLSACATTPTDSRLLGTLAGAGAAAAAKASNDAVIAGAVLGYVLGGIADKSYASGCRYASNPAAGALNFYNANDGIYLVCPPTRPGNKFIEQVRRDPNWQIVRSSSRPQQQYIKRGGVRSGPTPFG